MLDAKLILEQVRQEIARRKPLIQDMWVVVENRHSLAERRIIPLPKYGEIKIVCHDGKIKTIETNIKEQM